MHRYSYQKINAGNRISYFIQFITKPTKRKKGQWFNILQTDRVSAAADVAEIPQIISPESSRYASAHNHLTSQHVLSLHDIGVHVSIIGRYWCCKIVTMLFVQLLFHILKSSPVPFSALTLWHQTYKKLSLIPEVCFQKPVKKKTLKINWLSRVHLENYRWNGCGGDGLTDGVHGGAWWVTQFSRATSCRSGQVFTGCLGLSLVRLVA